MGHRGQLRGGGLGGADVEVAVDLLRVGADDLRAQPLRQLQRQSRLAGRGGAGDHGEEWTRHRADRSSTRWGGTARGSTPRATRSVGARRGGGGWAGRGNWRG